MSQCAASVEVMDSSQARAAGPRVDFRFAARSVCPSTSSRTAGILERLREEVLEEEDLDPALGERVGEGIVLLPRPLHPEDVVEEKVVLVPRREAPKLEVGTVEDDPPQRPDLRAHVEARGLLCTGASGHGRAPTIGGAVNGSSMSSTTMSSLGASRLWRHFSQM